MCVRFFVAISIKFGTPFLISSITWPMIMVLGNKDKQVRQIKGMAQCCWDSSPTLLFQPSHLICWPNQFMPGSSTWALPEIATKPIQSLIQSTSYSNHWLQQHTSCIFQHIKINNFIIHNVLIINEIVAFIHVYPPIFPSNRAAFNRLLYFGLPAQLGASWGCALPGCQVAIHLVSAILTVLLYYHLMCFNLGLFTPDKWCYVPDQTMPFQTCMQVPPYIKLFVCHKQHPSTLF